MDVNAQLISTNPLRMQISGIDIMGQYCLASTGGNNLAIDSPDNVILIRDASLTPDLRLSWNEVNGASQYKVYSSSTRTLRMMNGLWKPRWRIRLQSGAAVQPIPTGFIMSKR